MIYFHAFDGQCKIICVKYFAHAVYRKCMYSFMLQILNFYLMNFLLLSLWYAGMYHLFVFLIINFKKYIDLVKKRLQRDYRTYFTNKKKHFLSSHKARP